MKKQLKFRVLAFLAAIPALLLVYYSQANMYQLDPVLRMANLGGTMTHEGGHSLASLLTGGGLTEILIRPDGSGHAMIGGGNTFLILLAGYFSTTALTAAMFYVNNRCRWGDVIPVLLGFAFLILTFQYGAKISGGSTTILVGVLFSLFLIYVGIHPNIPIPGTGKHISLSNVVWMFCVNVISLYYAVGGILALRYLSQTAKHGDADDVSVFTDMFAPWMDPRTMASLWMWVSILIWVVVGFFILRYFFSKEEKNVG